MRTTNMKLEAFKLKLTSVAASAVLLLLGLGYSGSSFAEQPQPKTFSSPGEAAEALFQAAQKEDEPALEAILGAGKEVTSSSDEVEDKLEREQFTRKYQEMHRLVQEPDGTTVLYIGAENWPFPVPLFSKDGAWFFDSTTGVEEIKFRRVGENEATAIEVCEEFALTKTQREAKATSDLKAASEDPVTRFAQSLIAASSATDQKDSLLFHGYYFRRVTTDSAAGGSVKKGLALVAYPAEYRSSGVKTFIVTQKGIVFEKDLGPGTPTLAPSIMARSSGWRTVE